jgi:hypothetical protein
MTTIRSLYAKNEAMNQFAAHNREARLLDQRPGDARAARDVWQCEKLRALSH